MRDPKSEVVTLLLCVCMSECVMIKFYMYVWYNIWSYGDILDMSTTI